MTMNIEGLRARYRPRYSGQGAALLTKNICRRDELNRWWRTPARSLRQDGRECHNDRGRTSGIKQQLMPLADERANGVTGSKPMLRHRCPHAMILVDAVLVVAPITQTTRKDSMRPFRAVAEAYGLASGDL